MYKQIIPAEDWFFVSKDTGGKIVVFRVAAWALQEDGGDVVGLVGHVTSEPNRTPRLIPVPPDGGLYKHLSELTISELKAGGLPVQLDF